MGVSWPAARALTSLVGISLLCGVGFLARRELPLLAGRYLFLILVQILFDSLSLAMGLTTILTTIWDCPLKYTDVHDPYF
jgi:hypothetical protein